MRASIPGWPYVAPPDQPKIGGAVDPPQPHHGSGNQRFSLRWAAAAAARPVPAGGLLAAFRILLALAAVCRVRAAGWRDLPAELKVSFRTRGSL